ncbi:MAG: cytidine deaminase [Clostridiaceae bacterium]|jgi:cytidine deaminase|nr:cytidine deaminase [Clostridiaceae bacterium]
MDYNQLMEKAIEASKNSYSPYSHFAVGACVLCESGNMYEGCNFENASFGMTICAERNAIGTAVTSGDRNISAIAIYSPNMEDCLPCGACRQVLAEFDGDTDISIITKTQDGIKIRTLSELLPGCFKL